MERQSFKAGDLIIKQGDLGCNAYRLLSGQAEVFFTRGKDRVVLGRLGPGEIFGEMGMIEDKPRSASVQALEAVETEVVTPKDFNKMILHQPEELIPYLKSFFERLRRANELSSAFVLPEAEPAGPAPAASAEMEPGTVRVIAETETGRQRALKPDVLARKFPFRIGRWSKNFQEDVFVSNDFLIRDEAPFQISRNHCAIEREGDRYCVLDRGSALGTEVNGRRIGGVESQMVAPLRHGENQIVLGGGGSPYRFRIVVS